jgi:imidazolonepropionase-like amidohydrolase
MRAINVSSSLIVVVLVACISLSAQLPVFEPPSLLIRNVRLIDGNGSPPRDNVDVFARDGRIVSIATGSNERADLTIDGEGLFLLPGLIDAHVHFGFAGPTWAARAAYAKWLVQGGVTAVYDITADVRILSDLARAVLVGEIEGPTIYYSAFFAGSRFFADPREFDRPGDRGVSRGYRPGEAPWFREITPTTDLSRAVAEARGAGATSIKLYAALDADTVRRIGDEAKRQNVRLVAHATVFPAKPSDLVSAGVKYLAHAPYLVWEGMAPSVDFNGRRRGDFDGVPVDGPVITRLLHAMKANDVALNPTLYIFAEGRSSRDDLSAARARWMFAVTKRAQDIGVTIAAGVDQNSIPDDPLPSLHRELQVMVDGARLTPLQALTAATRGAAHAMGADGERGTIEPGRVADLLLVEGDPTVDIRHTRNIRYVIKDGRIVHAPRSKSR